MCSMLVVAVQKVASGLEHGDNVLKAELYSCCIAGQIVSYTVHRQT